MIISIFFVVMLAAKWKWVALLAVIKIAIDEFNVVSLGNPLKVIKSILSLFFSQSLF